MTNNWPFFLDDHLVHQPDINVYGQRIKAFLFDYPFFGIVYEKDRIPQSMTKTLKQQSTPSNVHHQTEEMGVSKNNGIPKSSILIGFSFINHPFWGTPIFGNTQIHRKFVTI